VTAKTISAVKNISQAKRHRKSAAAASKRKSRSAAYLAKRGINKRNGVVMAVTESDGEGGGESGEIGGGAA
jgi:hypothetical protein